MSAPDPIADDLSRKFGCKIFVKTGVSSAQAAFSAEAAALEEIASTNTVRVPRVLAHGLVGERAYIALEWLDLSSLGARGQARFGEQLATLHRVRAPTFGWRIDNTIGPTPQHNAPVPDWVEFWRTRRLEPQLALCLANGMARASYERGLLLAKFTSAFFASYVPQPSLLHGDLWGGNCAALREDEPVTFDPALYYGDREADIAMTRLFGGFSTAFYAAYTAAWPLDPGAGARSELYNLYHVLNHFNIFGGGYLRQAESMIERLLAELGH
jgi:protein-ribulosamine 3-kinase